MECSEHLGHLDASIYIAQESQALGQCQSILCVDPVREIADSTILETEASIEACSFDLI